MVQYATTGEKDKESKSPWDSPTLVQPCISETPSNAQSCERSQSQRQGGESESRVRADMDHPSKKARDQINSLSNRAVLVREEGPSALLQLSSEDMEVVSPQQL